MNEWQSISTAARDGTAIWAYNGEQARMVWSEGPEWALWIWHDQTLAGMDPSPVQPTHWMPLPPPPTSSDDEFFLSQITVTVQNGIPVSSADVARLRRLANWAECVPPPSWNGTLDKYEAFRAIADARKLLPK
jgi:hypothetical protein